MMSVSLLLGSALAAAATQTGDAHVDAFLADIAAGRREAAIGRIEELNSLSGRPNAVALVDEFVDKLLRCTFVSSQRRDFGGPMHDIRWRCPDGDYFSLLDGSYRPPRLVVGEFLSAAAREARRRGAAVAPPVPMPSQPPAPMPDAEAIRIVSDFLEAARAGDPSVPDMATFRLHFTDRRQPDSFISPRQLGRYLAPCRKTAERRMPGGGTDAGSVGMLWTCSGEGALAPEIITVMGLYMGRVSAGRVLVGRPQDAQPDR